MHPLPPWSTPSRYQLRAAVGTPVPQSMSIHQLSSNVTAQVPATKNLEYIKLDNNTVLLIDPKDRRVADILSPPGTTGAAPAPISPAPR